MLSPDLIFVAPIRDLHKNTLHMDFLVHEKKKKCWIKKKNEGKNNKYYKYYYYSIKTSGYKYFISPRLKTVRNKSKKLQEHK